MRRAVRTRSLRRHCSWRRTFDRLRDAPGRVVRRAYEALIQSAELDLCAGVDNTLRADCDRWLANVSTRTDWSCDGYLDVATGAELRVVPDVLRREATRLSIVGDRRLADINHLIRRIKLECRPHCGVLVSALRGVGRLRDRAQRLDFSIEQECPKSDDKGLSFRCPSPTSLPAPHQIAAAVVRNARGRSAVRVGHSRLR